MAQLINAYRAQQGLPPIPVSPLLTRVAEAHVLDSQHFPPAAGCRLHSWSAAGPWTPCCWTSGPSAPAACMWNKPREITEGRYTGHGFEISFGGQGVVVSPQDALEAWKRSSRHNAVILNQGHWKRLHWRAMGVGVSASFIHVWLGEEADR